jgi:hypothetical protein
MAHHPGGAGNVGGAGPIVTISAATLAEGQTAVAVMFEMTRIGAFSDGQLTSFASRHVHAHSMDAILAPSVAVAYGITNDVMVSARLPYILRTDIREGHHHHVHGGGAINEAIARGDAEGVGDLAALLHWRLVNDREAGTQWALLGGLKAPTGAKDRRDRGGELFELEFQPGSGSWDYMAGLAVSQRLGARLSLHANVLYSLVGTGDQQTNLGDRFQYNMAAAYRVTGAVGGYTALPYRLGGPGELMHHEAGGSLKDDHDHPETEKRAGLSFDVVLELNGEWHARQTIAGVTDPNSGGSVVYLAPGVRLSGDRWSTFLSVGVPVVNHLYGVQAEPDWRLVSGVAVSF